jgi:DNA-binding response OmpR family regulator
MRILIAEDQQEISSLLKSNLEMHGFSVDIEANGEKASYLARTNDYDVVILDYMLPDKNGDQVCQEIRESGKTCPIIILSVQTEVPTKVELLNMGADDYITKPFVFDELLARIRAVTRRPKQMQQNTVSLDDLTLDTIRFQVDRGGQLIHLTKKEFSLLEYMMRNTGSVLSRGIIMEHVWDMHGDLFSNTIETHILNLRRKIDLPGKRKLIHTLSGRGYKVDLQR